jgi:hypothetical protein
MVCITNWFVIIIGGKMESQLDIVTLKRKSIRYMDQDGLTEIMLGLILIALGFVFESLAIAVVLALLCLLCVKLLEKVRERFTYPRTGYVKFPAEYFKPSQRTLLFYFLCLTSVFVLLCYFTEGWDTGYSTARWTTFYIAGGSAISGLAVNYSRAPKIYFYGAVSIALGFYLSFISIVQTPDNILYGAAVWATWYGVFMLIAGVIVLIRFTHKYKLQPEKAVSDQ